VSNDECNVLREALDHHGTPLEGSMRDRVVNFNETTALVDLWKTLQPRLLSAITEVPLILDSHHTALSSTFLKGLPTRSWT